MRLKLSTACLNLYWITHNKMFIALCKHDCQTRIVPVFTNVECYTVVARNERYTYFLNLLSAVKCSYFNCIPFVVSFVAPLLSSFRLQLMPHSQGICTLNDFNLQKGATTLAYPCVWKSTDRLLH